MSDEIKEREEREHLDRAFASNDKVQFDNVMTHEKVMTGFSELHMKQAIDFQQKANDDYLIATKQMRDEYIKHSADRDAHTLENIRYTLDRLNSVYPEEASGLAGLLKVMYDFISEEENHPEK